MTAIVDEESATSQPRPEGEGERLFTSGIYRIMPERLVAARRAMGLTQQQLAARCGHGHGEDIETWERGRKSPSAASVVKLAKVLSVSVAYLLGQDGGAAGGNGKEDVPLLLESPAKPGRLKEARLKANLYHREVGERIGMTGEAVRRWEKGLSALRGDALLKVAGVLSVTPAWLQWSGEEEPAAQTEPADEAETAPAGLLPERIDPAALQELRHRARLSRRELAEAAGVSYAAVQSWEVGRFLGVGIKRVAALAAALGATPAQVAGEEALPEWGTAKEEAQVEAQVEEQAEPEFIAAITTMPLSEPGPMVVEERLVTAEDIRQEFGAGGDESEADEESERLTYCLRCRCSISEREESHTLPYGAICEACWPEHVAQAEAVISRAALALPMGSEASLAGQLRAASTLLTEAAARIEGLETGIRAAEEQCEARIASAGKVHREEMQAIVEMLQERLNSYGKAGEQ